ncbi:protein UXT homolog [Anthonomus grandis grandis]|uniref:protein UXT homolog n=1 Tax=Anthonomus grandis grandis TaxID=2921223 RepID=UPI0021662155|nr:protein UXT homolog [Anthonomus grandis grandis]
MDLHKKLKQYEHFIDQKLKPDLKDIESTLAKKSMECKEWIDLKTVVGIICEFKDTDRDMNVQLPLGNDVTTFAKICDYESTYVNVGLGCILEMDREEASKYADIRLRLLQKEINHLRKLAVNVKVHIKMVLLAISELQATLVNNIK